MWHYDFDRCVTCLFWHARLHHEGGKVCVVRLAAVNNGPCRPCADKKFRATLYHHFRAFYFLKSCPDDIGEFAGADGFVRSQV